MRFTKGRLEAIRRFCSARDQNFLVVRDKIWWLKGAVTGGFYLSEEGPFEDQMTRDTKANKLVWEAIKATEPKEKETEMTTQNTVIETTKQDITNIATGVAKRVAADKLLVAAGIPLEGILKKAGLSPEIARSPMAPAIIALVGILVSNSIQDLPKKQLVHELCSLYLEQTAVNLLSPVLGDLVSTFTQALEGIE